MSDLVLYEKLSARGKYMIAGWDQWADAGEVSSGLPKYLIEQTQARKIGEIQPEKFYLFQIPGSHHILRPVVKVKEGHVEQLKERRNEFYYSGDDENGFLIFLGEEPYQNEERYAEVFFDAVEQLGIKRIAAVAGVYGPVPYDKDRGVSCVYSLPSMKDELTKYAVRFSNYEDGATISMYLAHEAGLKGIEFFRFCGIVPFYDFSIPPIIVHSKRIEDFKAWYDLMRRLNYMFALNIDLSDLQRKSYELNSAFESMIDEIVLKFPPIEEPIREYMNEVEEGFDEKSFIEPLVDDWNSVIDKVKNRFEE